MSSFTDKILMLFQDNSFIENLVTNELGLINLYNLTYLPTDIEVKELSFGRIKQKLFQSPVFETIRSKGVEEKIGPTQDRVIIHNEQKRYGRLEWIDIYLKIVLTTKVHKTGLGLASITSRDLFGQIGTVNSLEELRTQLEALYTTSIVDEFFNKMKIGSLEDFKRNGELFLEFTSKQPEPYDPDDPKNVRRYLLNLCFKIKSDLDITNALQKAKLCRSILENQNEYLENFDEGEIDTPYVFVQIFPDALVTDSTIPGLTAAEFKSSTQILFSNEKMIAYFYSDS